MARRRGGGSHRFYSKAQWRWAFATHQRWARRHAHKTPGGPKARYRRLPRRKGPRRRPSRGRRR